MVPRPGAFTGTSRWSTGAKYGILDGAGAPPGKRVGVVGENMTETHAVVRHGSHTPSTPRRCPIIL